MRHRALLVQAFKAAALKNDTWAGAKHGIVVGTPSRPSALVIGRAGALRRSRPPERQE